MNGRTVSFYMVLLILVLMTASCQTMILPSGETLGEASFATPERIAVERQDELIGTWQVRLQDDSDYYFQFAENGMILGCGCPNQTDFHPTAIAQYRFEHGVLYILEAEVEDSAFADAGIHCSKAGQDVGYGVYRHVAQTGRPMRLVLEPVSPDYAGEDVVLAYVNR